MKTLAILAALLLSAPAFAQSTYDSNRAQERYNEQMRQQQQAYDNQVYQQRSLQLQQRQLELMEQQAQDARWQQMPRIQPIQPYYDREWRR